LDKSYFYCSQKCKDTCILFGLRGDPYRNINKPYTSAELNIFNKYVLKRDNEICYYCGEHANTVHHLRPQKLEPFFALDPDYARSCCEKCHYKYGHPTGSDHSTGNLAKVICSTESQKFLKQTL
jgi:5-methylcytosine-specific restriction endonuclease McrA